MNLPELLEQLHSEVAVGLLAKISSGTATAADYTAAISLLKHNGIECSKKADPNLALLAQALPFKEDELPA